jgi:hypothetical protein
MMMHCASLLRPTATIFFLYAFGATISFSDHKKLQYLPCSSAGPLEAGLLQMESMGPMHSWTKEFFYYYFLLFPSCLENTLH